MKIHKLAPYFIGATIGLVGFGEYKQYRDFEDVRAILNAHGVAKEKIDCMERLTVGIPLLKYAFGDKDFFNKKVAEIAKACNYSPE